MTPTPRPYPGVPVVDGDGHILEPRDLWERALPDKFKDLAIKPVRLKKTRVQSVYTPRVTEPLTAGRAYIYFFPLGQTEPAIVTMSNPEGDTVFSLVVHPITGRVRIYNQEVQPPSGRDRTDDEGNRVVP